MAQAQLERVRRLCLGLEGTSERLSHGEPTFFVGKRVFVMYADNHHGDGRLGVWLPAPAGVQRALIEQDPETYFRPPYVGVKGWVGIELEKIGDEALGVLVEQAWEMVKRSQEGKAGRRGARGRKGRGDAPSASGR
jgi:hypothetical protein